MVALWRSSIPIASPVLGSRTQHVGTRLTVHASTEERSPARSTESIPTARCALRRDGGANSSARDFELCHRVQLVRRQCFLRSMPAIQTSSLRLSTGASQTAWRIARSTPYRDEYAVWLHQLLELEGYGKDDVSSAIMGRSSLARRTTCKFSSVSISRSNRSSQARGRPYGRSL